MPIIRAVGIAVKADDPELQQALEHAMLSAVQAAQAEGIEDDQEILNRQMEAKAIVLADYHRE